MKKILLSGLFTLFIANIFGQIFNIKTGLWSNPAVWSNNSVPSANDDVVLKFDIVVDINAVCNSLSLSGHNITINSGFNLFIAGNKPGTDSTLLKLYVELDTTKPAPSDTVNKVQFIYDTIKRVSRVEAKNFLGNYSGTTIITYNGADTMPVKAINYSTTIAPSSQHDTSTEYYFYDLKFRLIKDSISYSVTTAANEGNLYEVWMYNYSAVNIRSVYKRTDIYKNGYTEENLSYQTFENNDIVTQIDTSLTGDITNSKFIYDNKINPFNRIGRAFHPVFDYEIHNTDNSQTNNMTEIIQSFTNEQFVSSHHYRYSYVYNSRNYPVSVIIENLLESHIDINKGVFIYTNQ